MVYWKWVLISQFDWFKQRQQIKKIKIKQQTAVMGTNGKDVHHNECEEVIMVFEVKII